MVEHTAVNRGVESSSLSWGANQLTPHIMCGVFVCFTVTASKMIWKYILQLSFNLLLLTGDVKLDNTTFKEMLGA